MSQGLIACSATIDSPAPFPSSRSAAHEALVAPWRERALALEQQGELKKALDHWKIALTIDPNEPLSVEGKKRVESRVNQSLADALSRGQEALKRGLHLEARRHFLLVLALDPANRIAFDLLQTEIKETRVIQHNVRKGESLSSIAEFYYADRSRSEVIWEVNQLPPNPKIAPGLVLRIPEIPGLQFRPQGPRATSPAVETPKPEITEVVGIDANPMLDEARDGLERKEFSLALASVDKFLGQNPRSAEALDLKKALLYEQAKSFFEQKKYADSYLALNQLSKLSPNYQDTAALLGRARTQLVSNIIARDCVFTARKSSKPPSPNGVMCCSLIPTMNLPRKTSIKAERLLEGLQQRQQKK